MLFGPPLADQLIFVSRSRCQPEASYLSVSVSLWFKTFLLPLEHRFALLEERTDAFGVILAGADGEPLGVILLRQRPWIETTAHKLLVIAMREWRSLLDPVRRCYRLVQDFIIGNDPTNQPFCLRLSCLEDPA